MALMSSTEFPDFLFGDAPCSPEQVLPASPPSSVPKWAPSCTEELEGFLSATSSCALSTTSSNFDKTEQVIGIRAVTRGEEDLVRKRKERNRISATISRKKKKAQISQMEQEFNRMRAEHTHLKDRNSVLETENDRLIREVAYLKSVLKNESTLSALLTEITPRIGGKRKRDAVDLEEGGLCLCVGADGSVVVEMCHECSAKRARVGVVVN